MKKFMFILFCSLFVFAICPAEVPVPRGKDFDWHQADGERQQMREKIRAEHRKYVSKLENFHKRYAAENDPAKKEAIRAELRAFLAKYFNERIEHSKKRIESMKQFVARLEAEQKKMEANADKIVEKRTNEILSGQIKPPRKNPPIKK